MSAITGPFPHDQASTAPAYVAGEAPVDNYLTHGKGIRSWIFTLDHKRIAIMYMVLVLSNFALGGMFAVGLRTMLWNPRVAIPGNPASQAAANASYDLYNHFFTLHGAVMVFLFIIPAVPAIFGNFVMPMQLGAKDVAFPRLNLLSLWLYFLGGLFFVYLLLSGVLHAIPETGWARHFHVDMPGGWGLDTGWTFYTPYSSARAQGAVTAAVLGVFILGFSSILTGVNFIATMHMLRPKGMTWFRMPLFCWALYATSIMQILATPVLAITVLLLAAERVVGVGIFDPRNGGDPVLFQHFFWFYSHPAVYIMILPAMGVISEVIVVYSRKHIFGYNFVAMSSLAIALVSFLVWGHHMFVSGQSPLSASVFSLLTFAVAIPSAVKVFNWLGTLYKGDIRVETPMLYVMGFLYLFTIGGLTGLFLASLATDIPLTHTYFIVAHFHYVMMGSTLFAFLAGMYYWWPKMFGRIANDNVGRIGFLLIFIGFNLTFFPQFVMGARGMPRRYASYPMQFQIFHRLSTAGAYTMASGLVLAGLNLGYALKRGKRATDNPWGASTLEWATSSPPPHDNFNYTPEVGDPYDLHGIEYDPKTGNWSRNPAVAAASRSASGHDGGPG
ncbi:MAG TPA: cbb3-type cytochrome c oxidase subunit I [Tepidisphaeraceae bacterium]|nr:cbb3-type cytochrome c oxidase subunit I [Tepidisphaeraceae bacterium]